jgi:hypothetical protein
MCWRCGKLTTITAELRCSKCNLDSPDLSNAENICEQLKKEEHMLEDVIQCPHCKTRFELIWGIGIVSTPEYCPFCAGNIRDEYIKIEKQHDD